MFDLNLVALTWRILFAIQNKRISFERIVPVIKQEKNRRFINLARKFTKYFILFFVFIHRNHSMFSILKTAVMISNRYRSKLTIIIFTTNSIVLSLEMLNFLLANYFKDFQVISTQKTILRDFFIEDRENVHHKRKLDYTASIQQKRNVPITLEPT